MATSIASALTGRQVNKALAMTGEVTLRGRVLPIGFQLKRWTRYLKLLSKKDL
jgi:ATP-dependent Lon protease